jgi:stage V sporulation protein S
MNIIKVSGTSRTSAVAGAIAGVFRENKRAEVQAIGAIAVNQAVKALALAKGYLKEDGFEIVFTPEFVDVEIDGKVAQRLNCCRASLITGAAIRTDRLPRAAG